MGKKLVGYLEEVIEELKKKKIKKSSSGADGVTCFYNYE